MLSSLLQIPFMCNQFNVQQSWNIKIPSLLKWSSCIKFVIVPLKHFDMHYCILVYTLLCCAIALSHFTILLLLNAFVLLYFFVAFCCVFLNFFQLHTNFIDHQVLILFPFLVLWSTQYSNYPLKPFFILIFFKILQIFLNPLFSLFVT
jgi:hypothetical protein